MLKKTKMFFINLKNWFPILVSDRQWDGQYLFEVMEHKLVLMEKFYKYGKTYAVGSEDRAKEIRESIDVLERIIEGDYMSPEARTYYKSIAMEDITENRNITPEHRELIMK